MLQFITNENSTTSPAEQMRKVMEGGCRWIQIRLKDASDDEIKNIFFEIRDKAKETLTTVLINDRVELVKSLASEGIAGVHVGHDDMPAAEAREFLGPDAIIGVTAHSFDEVKEFKGLDVDYIGVGPYAFTKTKKDLSPILGLEGMAEIVLLSKELNIEIPLVAVGGIKIDDVKPLLEVGVNGIAISGEIANADDIAKSTADFIAELPIGE